MAEQEPDQNSKPVDPAKVSVGTGLPDVKVTLTPIEPPEKQPFRIPENISLKLARYVIFGTLAALLPFLFDAISTHAKTNEITSFDLFRKGELFLVTTGIGFAATEELLGINKKCYQVPKVIIGGLCALSAVAEAGLYGWAHTQVSPFNGRDATELSLMLFWTTFILGSVCIVLSEIE